MDYNKPLTPQQGADFVFKVLSREVKDSEGSIPTREVKDSECATPSEGVKTTVSQALVFIQENIKDLLVGGRLKWFVKQWEEKALAIGYPLETTQSCPGSLHNQQIQWGMVV